MAPPTPERAKPGPLRVLVVDDSAVFRRVIVGIVQEVPGVEVVATAVDGATALEMIDLHRPDAVVLDVDMPEVDGLEFLRRLRGRPIHPAVIILSAASDQGARSTMQALHLGAFDFVIKPGGADPFEGLRVLRERLQPRLQNLVVAANAQLGVFAPPAPLAPPALPRVVRGPTARRGPLIVAIGISTGGPDALGHVLPALPGSLPVPVLIVQHMPPMFTRTLADDLDGRSRVRVREACDGDAPRPGEVLIAPGGRQMKIVGVPSQARIRITDDPPEQSCRPAVDYLFRSVAEVYGAGVLGIVMTGMGNDGTAGSRAIRARGGTILAQDQATSVVYGMPRGPAEHGLAEAIVPLERIAEEIIARTAALMAA